jgi:hypothetical protein
MSGVHWLQLRFLPKEFYVDRRRCLDLCGGPDGAYRTDRGRWNYDLFGLLRVAIIYTFLYRGIEAAETAA